MYRLPTTRPERASIVNRKISRRRRVSPLTTQYRPTILASLTRLMPFRCAIRVASRRSILRDLRSMRTPSRSIVMLCAFAVETVGMEGVQTQRAKMAGIKGLKIFMRASFAERFILHVRLRVRAAGAEHLKGQRLSCQFDCMHPASGCPARRHARKVRHFQTLRMSGIEHVSIRSRSGISLNVKP